MQQDIHVVMSGWVQAEKLAVERVGKPGQGMPVRHIVSGESPFHGRPRQARPDVRILRNVLIVVIAEETVVNHGVVRHKHNGGQQQTQQQRAFRRRLKQLGGSRDSRSFEAFRCRGRGRRTHGFNDSEPDTKDSRGRTAKREFPW